MHNTRYVEYAMEALPAEDYARAPYTELRIAYRRAVTAADRITVKRAAADDGVRFCLYSDGALCALAELK